MHATESNNLNRSEQRYARLTEATRTTLTSLRTPSRRRMLVTALYACLAVMAVVVVTGYFWFTIVVAWIPLTLAVIILWTMLRIAIDKKDEAPLSFLDELEVETLMSARSRAFSVVSWFLFVMAFVLIFGSTFEVGDGHRLAYTMGGLSILAFLTGAMIPAAAMSRTMDDEEA